MLEKFDITIERIITDTLPNFDIYACMMDVSVKDYVISNFQDEVNKIKEKYDLSDLLKIPEINDARLGYKALKADPNRVHLSCEGLVRRILKGNDLYNVNNIVDVGNLLSIRLLRSVCVCDFDEVVGSVKVTKAPVGTQYYGIHRGKINVDNLVCYQDDVSFFGNPTSDIERTMITNDTKRILVMVINFSKEFNKENIKDNIIDLFKEVEEINLETYKEVKVNRE